jgi:hypothetical protein
MNYSMVLYADVVRQTCVFVFTVLMSSCVLVCCEMMRK